MKYLLIAAAVAGIALSGAASAATMATCDDATMMKVEADLKAMTDPAKKDMMMMGMEEMEKAKTAMKGNMGDECSKHLDAAMKASMGQ